MYPHGWIQNPILFRRGNATSFDPTWYGIKKFAKPPKYIGTTTKKTIISPCAVITWRYRNESPLKNVLPGYANSNLIIVAKAAPDKPVIILK